MVVVLPAPFGPTKPETTPFGMARSRSSTTVRRPNRLVKPLLVTAYSCRCFSSGSDLAGSGARRSARSSGGGCGLWKRCSVLGASTVVMVAAVLLARGSSGVGSQGAASAVRRTSLRTRAGIDRFVPELPDVDGFRRVLLQHAVGERIVDIEVRDAGSSGSGRRRTSCPLSADGFSPSRRESGKWLMAPTDGPTLLAHFGMTGNLVWAGLDREHGGDRDHGSVPDDGSDRDHSSPRDDGSDRDHGSVGDHGSERERRPDPEDRYDRVRFEMETGRPYIATSASSVACGSPRPTRRSPQFSVGKVRMPSG